MPAERGGRAAQGRDVLSGSSRTGPSRPDGLRSHFEASKPGRNVLELEVTNLAANRVHGLWSRAAAGQDAGAG
ncbi:MAG: hypothetical protein M3545_17470 [Acidobacteriota bacterium]|nr:hypothetical protein [Acidobacteriota bacterium]